MVPEFRATLEKVTLAAAETKVFRFRLSESEHPFSFKAGQFISLKIEEKVFRAYSLSSSPDELPLFEICAKIIPGGMGSMYLDALNPGSEIFFRGGVGNFVIKNPEKDKIFFATGTGIAPIKAFSEEIAAGKLSGMHELVFGVRTADYAPYTEEFRSLQKSSGDFAFTLCVSQPETDAGFDFKGRITDWARAKDPEYFFGKDMYICGSPEMVKELTGILKEEKSILKECIYTEAY